jgi:hypothetical protein
VAIVVMRVCILPSSHCVSIDSVVTHEMNKLGPTRSVQFLRSYRKKRSRFELHAGNTCSQGDLNAVDLFLVATLISKSLALVPLVVRSLG